MSTSLFSRSQTLFSPGNSIAPSEYVEDSEPEREERRAREKTKSRRKKPTRPAKATRVPSTAPDVIELSDSDRSSHPPPKLPGVASADKQIEVIDITDSTGFLPDDDPVELSVDPIHVPERLVESGGEDTTTDVSLPSIRDILGLPRTQGRPSAPQLSSTNGAPRVSSPNPVSLPPPQVLDTRQGPESDDESDGKLRLSRFAYSDPSIGRRTASKTPSPTEHGTPDIQPQAGPSKVRRTASARMRLFAADFSDAELARLSKCVACDAAWTVRKTVAHKMKHIQACAKKKKLTDETVVILLRNELHNSAPVASATVEPDPVAVVPETLLEDVLKDAQKKKPGRRPQVQQTVKSVSETRVNILDRARVLLQDTRNTAHNHVPRPAPSAHVDAQMPPPTQAFGRSAIATAHGPQCSNPADNTHEFAPSRLASRAQIGVVRAGADIAAHSDISPLTQAPSSSGQGIVASLTDLENEAPPPATQVFAPSKFYNARRNVVARDDDPTDDPISIHDTSHDDLCRSPPRSILVSSPPPRSSSAKRPRSSPNPKSPARAAHPTAPSRRSPSPRDASRAGELGADGSPRQPEPSFDFAFAVQTEDYCEWNNAHEEGAYLYYDPGDDGSEAGPIAGPSGSKHTPEPPDDEPVAGPSGVKDAPAPAPGEEPPKKRTRRKKAVEGEAGTGEQGVGKDISQEDLNAKLKEAILADEALHLRVLRYEPIHFDVFMKLATDLGISAKRTGLKLKVRAFLDQKAIHFYGADPSKNRTRRAWHA